MRGFIFPWTVLNYLFGIVLGGILGALITLTACGVYINDERGGSWNGVLIVVSCVLLFLFGFISINTGDK